MDVFYKPGFLTMTIHYDGIQATQVKNQILVPRAPDLNEGDNLLDYLVLDVVMLLHQLISIRRSI